MRSGRAHGREEAEHRGRGVGVEGDAGGGGGGGGVCSCHGAGDDGDLGDGGGRQEVVIARKDGSAAVVVELTEMAKLLDVRRCAHTWIDSQWVVRRMSMQANGQVWCSVVLQQAGCRATRNTCGDARRHG